MLYRVLDDSFVSLLAMNPVGLSSSPEQQKGFPWWGWLLGLVGFLFIISLFGQKGGDASDHGEHWHQVGELGGNRPYIRFVEVDAASAHDGSVYRDAVNKVCGPDSGCFQLGIFLPGDQIPSGDKGSFFKAGGWANYSPAAVWTGDDFTKWDCDKAGVEGAPASALCGKGASEQYDAILALAARVGWTVGCHLPATHDRDLVESFAKRQGSGKYDKIMQDFEGMEKTSESGPDNPADCQNLRPRIEEHARSARKVLSRL